MIDALGATTVTRHMTHMQSIYYFRTAFDLHHRGMPMEEAEGKARRQMESWPGLDVNVIFPPIPWSRFKEIYPDGN